MSEKETRSVYADETAEKIMEMAEKTGWDMEKTVSTPVIVKPRRKTKYPCGVQHPLECLECKYSRCISENYPAMRGEWYKETKVWQK